MRLPVDLLGPRSGVGEPAVVVDLTLAGAGLETDEPLLPGEHLSIILSTPTMWDPLVLEAVVAWAHPPLPSAEVDAVGRSRSVARAGVAFAYDAKKPATILAVLEVLATLGYD